MWASKTQSSRVKRQPSEWEKIFANHEFGKCLEFRIYKESLQLNNRRQTTQFKNGKRLE